MMQLKRIAGSHHRIGEWVRCTSIIGGLCLFLLLFGPTFQAQRSNIDLASSPDLMVVGMVPYDGVTVTGPGSVVGSMNAITADLNNDGLSDLIVGVPFNDGPENNRSNCGAVYVILGQRQQPPPVMRDLAQAKPEVIVYGGKAGELLGTSLASGDVNGDGIPDLIIGNPNADSPDGRRPKVGQVYVLFGGPSLLATPVRDAAQGSPGDVTIIGWGRPHPTTGNLPPEQAGASVASGDVDKDGIDDIVIGAPGVKGPDGKRIGDKLGEGTYPGAVYVFHGSKNLTRGMVKDIGSGGASSPQGVDMVIYGRTWPVSFPGVGSIGNVGEGLGTQVAVGDINRDQIGDIIIGAPYATEKQSLGQGAVYVINGKTTRDEQRDTVRTSGPLAPDATLLGVENTDFLGNTLAVGDVNGDGFDDLIFGINSSGGPSNRRPGAGTVYVVFGSSSLSGKRDLERQRPDVFIYGGRAGDGLGYAVATGDVNGDGVKDIVVGAPAANGPSRKDGAGEVYVFYGGVSLPAGSFRDVVEEAGPGPEVAIYGAQVADQVGFSIAVGKLNNDQKADIVMTAPFSDGTLQVQRFKAGAVYAIFGR